jgi:thiamine pyrophosphate-dependent acetolactate synthase large subunit-like protein
VTEMANRLGAGVAKALLGKDVLPDDLPFVTGAIGLLGIRTKLGPDARLRYAFDSWDRLPMV